MYEQAIRSGQSQKLVVGGIVNKYSTNAEKNDPIAMYLFILLWSDCIDSITNFAAVVETLYIQ
jgi:hypothetical protein